MIDIEELKQKVEADDNIVSFALFYDRKKKKMVFIKHGNDSIIDKMLDRASYSIHSFAASISKIAWRWTGNREPGMDMFAPGSPEQHLFDMFKNGFRK